MFQCTILIFWYDNATYQSAHPHLIVLGCFGRVTHSVPVYTCAVMQTTAARCGMFTKDSYDEKSVRWSDNNPLRVRDVSYALRELIIEGEDGETEATSHMQINWRRVKRHYFEVYLFRSAVTANSKWAVGAASDRAADRRVTYHAFTVCALRARGKRLRGPGRT